MPENTDKGLWCALDLMNGRVFYCRITEDLKAVVANKRKDGFITLLDAFVSVPLSGGTVAVSNLRDLSGQFTGPMAIAVNSIVSRGEMKSDSEWSKGLDKVEAGETKAAVVVRPSSLQVPR